MNYRHAFHAGNFADVMKHVALVRVLTYLRLKDKPFRVIDTHAGRGAYQLDAPDAQRTGEALGGIDRVLAVADRAAETGQPLPAGVQDYVACVRAHGKMFGPANYPGSPALAHALLRDQDRLHANERQPDEHARLAKRFAGDRRVIVTDHDGWQIVKSALPPVERRGVVLLDPPFEQAGEFDRLLEALAAGIKRFATGVFMIWYPIKDARAVARFHRGLSAFQAQEPLVCELDLNRAERDGGLAATGLIVCNAPFTFADGFAKDLAWIAQACAASGRRPRHRVQPVANVLAAANAGPRRAPRSRSGGRAKPSGVPPKARAR